VIYGGKPPRKIVKLIIDLSIALLSIAETTTLITGDGSTSFTATALLILVLLHMWFERKYLKIIRIKMMTKTGKLEISVIIMTALAEFASFIGIVLGQTHLIAIGCSCFFVFMSVHMGFHSGKHNKTKKEKSTSDSAKMTIVSVLSVILEILLLIIGIVGILICGDEHIIKSVLLAALLLTAYSVLLVIISTVIYKRVKKGC
jgi:hypothetical protein